MTERTWNNQLKDWLVKSLSRPELNKGARVKIRKNSRYAKENCSEEERDIDIRVRDSHGTIDRENYVHVTFEKGYKGFFHKRDLELVDYVPEEQLKSGRLDNKYISTIAEMMSIPELYLKSYLDGTNIDLSAVPKNHREDLYRITGLSVFKPEFNLPTFKGREVYIDRKRHIVNGLGGEFGEKVLEEYHKVVEAEYKGYNHSLGVLSMYEGKVRGSNAFSAVLINQIIGSEGIMRIATPADLEMVLWQEPHCLGSYHNTALVLREQCKYNSILNKNLVEQIRKRDGKIKYPAVIPLADLELDDKNSDVSFDSGYGLAFKLREDAKVIHAPELEGRNTGLTFSRTDNKGIPIVRIEDGNRYLHTKQCGLTGMNTDCYGSVLSDCPNLSHDHMECTIIVVSTEGERETF